MRHVLDKGYFKEIYDSKQQPEWKSEMRFRTPTHFKRICFPLLLATTFLVQHATLSARDNDEDETRILTKEVRTIPGPKRTIAVMRFGSAGAFDQVYGNWDVGAGMEAMLTTALIETGQFIVVERANLTDVLSEQELAASGITGKG